jgi:hypothetical protein
MTDEKIKPVAYQVLVGGVTEKFCVSADRADEYASHLRKDIRNNVEVRPLYPEFALAQAREEGRIAGLREAAEKCKYLVEAAEKVSANIVDGQSMRVSIEDLIALKDTVAALNEKPIDPNKWAFDRGLESY